MIPTEPAASLKRIDDGLRGGFAGADGQRLPCWRFAGAGGIIDPMIRLETVLLAYLNKLAGVPMDTDPRDTLWTSAFDTYYDVYYEELVADEVNNRWQILDEVTKVLVALTASGSAISGWILWNEPNPT